MNRFCHGLLGPGKTPELAREGMNTLAEENFTIKILEQGDGKILRRPELEAYSAQFEKVKQSLDAGLVSWCVVPMRTAKPRHSRAGAGQIFLWKTGKVIALVGKRQRWRNHSRDANSSSGYTRENSAENWRFS